MFFKQFQGQNSAVRGVYVPFTGTMCHFIYRIGSIFPALKKYCVIMTHILILLQLSRFFFYLPYLKIRKIGYTISYLLTDKNDMIMVVPLITKTI